MTSHKLEKDNQTHTTDKESAFGKYNKHLQINKKIKQSNKNNSRIQTGNSQLKKSSINAQHNL